MAKIRVFRYSGYPVEPEAKAAFDTDFRLFFDKAEKRAGPDMKKLQRFISYGERLLNIKHSATVEVEMPKSERAWAKLVEKYQAPILIAATSTNAKKMVLIIMDEGIA